MTGIMYGELARKAREEVKDLEEPYRSIAYKTILDEMIREAKSSLSIAETSLTTRAIDTQETSPVEQFMGRAIDASAFGKLFSARGYLVEKCMAVLKLARDEFGIDGLSSGDINGILIRKFRVGGVHRNNIARDLGNATQHVSRIESGEGPIRFMLMVQGEQRLSDIVSELALEG